MTGRILCLGDSLTYGFGLPRGLVWTALCAAQTGAELLGWGVNGNTTGGMLAVLPELLVREHPDAGPTISPTAGIWRAPGPTWGPWPT